MSTDHFPSLFPSLAIDQSHHLREQRIDDTEQFFQYYTDPHVGRYILASKPASLQEAAQEIRYCRSLFYDEKGIYWTLATCHNNFMIGAIGLYIDSINHRAEITYDLNKAFWGQGIMKKAMQTVMTYSFDTLQLARLEAITHPDNQASIGLLNALGFQREGTLKQYRRYRNTQWDIEMFARVQ